MNYYKLMKKFTEKSNPSKLGWSHDITKIAYNINFYIL